MTHEREHERSPSDRREPARDPDVAPGRTSRTATMTGPTAPLVSGLIMRKAAGDAAGDGAEHAVARAAGTSGHALPGELRDRFETSLGTDLSGVRVHTDAASHTAADAVGAKAYAVGDQVHFAAGQYDPGSTTGQELIAHEVAHTVQQRGGAPSRQHKLAVSHAGDALEVEADRAAAAMVAGAPATVTGGGGGVIARRGDKPQSEMDKMKNTGKSDGKVSSDKASLPDRSVDLTLWGVKTTVSFKNGVVVGGSIPFKLPPTELFKFPATKLPVQIGPGGGMLVISGGITGSMSASLGITGGTKEFPGPRDETTGYFLKATAGGSMGITATGRVELLVYAGAGWANVNAGGYAELTANAKIKVEGGGEGEIAPDGTPGGRVSIGVEPSITVKAAGGFTVGWEALFASGKFYEAELASWDLLEAKLGKKSIYDIGTGAARTEETPADLMWKPIRFSDPKLIDKKVGKTAVEAAKRAADKVKDAERKKGRDHDAQKSVDPDEGKTTEPTDCHPSSGSCDGEGA